MSEPRFEFEYTDERARTGCRELLLDQTRRALDLKTLLVLAVGTALFVWSYMTPTSPTWWLILTGSVPAGLIALAAAWALAYWWMPRKAAEKLAHLPHRRVEVRLTPERFCISTATENVQLAWSEISAVDELPSFVVVKARAGGQLPILRAALGEAGLSELKRLAAKKDKIGT